MQAMDPGTVTEERSLRELVSQLSRDGSLLVQQEIALAKQELAEKASKVQMQLASMAVGGLVLYAGALTLIAALVLLLAQVVAGWLAAAMVGVAVTSIGAILVLRGKKNLQELDVTPHKTIESVKRDVEAMKEAAQ